MPAGMVGVVQSTPVFGLSASQIGRRVKAACQAAGLFRQLHDQLH